MVRYGILLAFYGSANDNVSPLPLSTISTLDTSPEFSRFTLKWKLSPALSNSLKASCNSAFLMRSRSILNGIWSLYLWVNCSRLLVSLLACDNWPRTSLRPHCISSGSEISWGWGCPRVSLLFLIMFYMTLWCIRDVTIAHIPRVTCHKMRLHNWEILLRNNINRWPSDLSDTPSEYKIIKFG